jgi:pyocin large subunit-like protein
MMKRITTMTPHSTRRRFTVAFALLLFAAALSSVAMGSTVFGGREPKSVGFDAPRGGLRSANTWGRSSTLADHFRRHGADFAARTADDYAEAASNFLRRSQAERLPTKIDAQGVIRVYDPTTNTFGAYNPSGTTRTFYKPNPATHGYPTNLDYWNAQPGVSP